MQGNGLRYKLILRTDAGWDTVGEVGGVPAAGRENGRRVALLN